MIHETAPGLDGVAPPASDDDLETGLPEGAILNANGTVTYTLKHPIRYKQGGADATISEVTFQRPTMAVHIATEKVSGTNARAALMIEMLTGLDAKFVAKLDDADWMPMGSIVANFE